MKAKRIEGTFTMNRKQLIEELKEYFDVRELVCPHVFGKHGHNSWMFFSYECLDNLLTLRRDVLKVPLTCNNWHIGGAYTQRGLRCNLCQLVKSKTQKGQLYMSAHCLGEAFDFTVGGGKDAQWARETIKDNLVMFPHPCRIEKGVTWLHFDSYTRGDLHPNGEPIWLIEFNG